MTILGRLLIVAAAVLLVIWQPAKAQGITIACGERSVVVSSLGDKFSETRHGGGLAGPSAIFELFASEETGTWTILRTGANGISCVMAVGNGWQNSVKPDVMVVVSNQGHPSAAYSLSQRMAARRAVNGENHIRVRREGVVEELSLTLITLLGGGEL